MGLGGTSYSDGGGAELDCLKGVFDLKETTLRREGAGPRLVFEAVAGVRIDGLVDG